MLFTRTSFSIFARVSILFDPSNWMRAFVHGRRHVCRCRPSATMHARDSARVPTCGGVEKHGRRACSSVILRSTHQVLCPKLKDTAAVSLTCQHAILRTATTP